MKIQFLKTLSIEIYNHRINDFWDKEYNRWDEIYVDRLNYNEDKYVDADLPNGDYMRNIPISAIKIIK